MTVVLWPFSNSTSFIFLQRSRWDAGHTTHHYLIWINGALVHKECKVYLNIKRADRSSESWILMQKFGDNISIHYTISFILQKKHQPVTKVSLSEKIHNHLHKCIVTPSSLVARWAMALYHRGNRNTSKDTWRHTNSRISRKNFI